MSYIGSNHEVPREYVVPRHVVEDRASRLNTSTFAIHLDDEIGEEERSVPSSDKFVVKEHTCRQVPRGPMAAQKTSKDIFEGASSTSHVMP